MAVDTNEIGGFLAACTNLGYLHSLRLLVEERIRLLTPAAPPAPPKPPPDTRKPLTPEDRARLVEGVRRVYGPPLNGSVRPNPAPDQVRIPPPVTMDDFFPAENVQAAPEATIPAPADQTPVEPTEGRTNDPGASGG